MSKQKIKTEPTCCFEWYDKATRSMKVCGNMAVILYRGKPLCAECSAGIDKSNTAIVRIK